MRVGIITFINTINFGASLQALALQDVVESFGEEAEIIQYTNQTIEKAEKGNGRQSIKGLIKHIILNRYNLTKAEKFEKYEKKHLHKGMTLTEQTASKINEKYDLFITGSDQVWNASLTNGDLMYFLSFVQDENKRVSYAPSFGNSVFPEKLYDTVTNLLQSYKAVSVREKSGAEFAQKLTGREVETVLDPTLLLNAEEWKNKFDFKPQIEHYILVYFPHDKTKVFNFVKKLKEKTGLPVVYLSISPRRQSGVKTIYDASPDEFLGWVYYSDYVVTGSFHGTAFSLNMGKEFFYEPSGEGSRIDNLVKLTQTEYRSIDNTDVLQSSIDYKIVEDTLEKERSKSKMWLKCAIEEDSDE